MARFPPLSLKTDLHATTTTGSVKAIPMPLSTFSDKVTNLTLLKKRQTAMAHSGWRQSRLASRCLAQKSLQR